MNIIDLKDYPKIKAVIKAVDPKYKKRSAFLIVTDSVCNYGSYWDSGSKKSMYVVSGSGNVTLAPGPNAPPMFGGGEPVKIDVPINGFIVTTGIFRGKTAKATVYTREDEL